MNDVGHGQLAEEGERHVAVDVVEAALLEEDAAVLVAAPVVGLAAPLVRPAGVAGLEEGLAEDRHPLAFLVKVMDTHVGYVEVRGALHRA